MKTYLLIMNARPLACVCLTSSYNLIQPVCIDQHFALGLFTFLSFCMTCFLPLSMAGWQASGISLVSPFLPVSVKSRFLFLLTSSARKSCLYLLPSYWPFGFLLAPLAALGRQGKQKQYIFAQLSKDFISKCHTSLHS